ncbi:MAG: hypothetical protein IT578_07610 [Verrucomicrobiae bacterium]|nr:hypothetical protein [Verrucomicrobiae bacterium]
MDFDWLHPPFNVKAPFVPREIEEAFEDPFGLKLAPDAPAFAAHARYVCLGRTAAGRGIFSLYRTNGNQIRVLATRPFTTEEDHFYDRAKQQSL